MGGEEETGGPVHHRRGQSGIRQKRGRQRSASRFTTINSVSMTCGELLKFYTHEIVPEKWVTWKNGRPLHMLIFYGVGLLDENHRPSPTRVAGDDERDRAAGSGTGGGGGVPPRVEAAPHCHLGHLPGVGQRLSPAGSQRDPPGGPPPPPAGRTIPGRSADP